MALTWTNNSTPLTAGNLNQCAVSHGGGHLSIVCGWFAPAASPAITECEGVTSITKNGTGDYWVNFDGAFTDVRSWSADVNVVIGTAGTIQATVYSCTNTRAKIKVFAVSGGGVTDAVDAVCFTIIGIV